MANSSVQRYSVYDHMERKGVFSANPANSDARNSEGKSTYKRLEYPKMFYHPEGEEKVLSPEHVDIDRGREVVIPAKYELISEVVDSPEAERRLRAAGWWDHPAKAIEAGNKRAKLEGRKPKLVPPRGLDQVAQGLEAELVARDSEIEELKAALKKAQSSKSASSPS